MGRSSGRSSSGTVNNGLNLLGVQTFWQAIVQGLILVGAVGLDALVQHRHGRPFRIAVLTRPLLTRRR